MFIVGYVNQSLTLTLNPNPEPVFTWQVLMTATKHVARCRCVSVCLMSVGLCVGVSVGLSVGLSVDV